jgi:hypothetical protein
VVNIKAFLGKRKLSSFGWLTEDGGSRFESHVSEYVNLMPLEDATNCLVRPRTSEFYPQLVAISLKKYLAAHTHAVLASRGSPQHMTSVPPDSFIPTGTD